MENLDGWKVTDAIDLLLKLAEPAPPPAKPEKNPADIVLAKPSDHAGYWGFCSNCLHTFAFCQCENGPYL